MKVFNFVLGIFAIFCGVSFIIYPIESLPAVAFMIAFLLGAWGVCAIANYILTKKIEGAQEAAEVGWHQGNSEDAKIGGIGLVIGIASVVLAILAFFVESVMETLYGVSMYLLIAWMVVFGIYRVVFAIKFSKAAESGYWIVELLLGILLAFAGLCAFGNVFLSILMQETVFGIMFITTGVVLLAAVFSKNETGAEG